MINNSKILPLLFFFYVAVQFACNKPIKSKKELLAYVYKPDNGLTSITQAGEIETRLSYIPWQAQAYDNQSKKIKLNPKSLISIKNNYAFVLGFSKDKKEVLRQLDFNTYSEILQVLAFRMQNYIVAKIDGGKPVTPLSCTFQQTYGMSTTNNLLLIFDKKAIATTGFITVFVKEFGLKTGDFQFRINTSDITKLQKNIQF
ncbi:hypothetical protein [Pedobacter nototheniae]|uniref:hypothetical protein n=1 Tax=Pedobacter nototheniae TaxID=2488994 RepID=UPI00103E2498|nr:hypothetical protein [Pedobacter nototheniae]